MKNVTRKDFLKGTAAGLGAVALAALPGGVARAETPEISWDEEYDVVVLGYGGAGANAAVAAYEQGAKVLLAEKAPEGAEGGNTAVSGQFVMATDDADGLYDYLTTLMGKFQNWDPEAVRAYCEGCAENYNWMTGPMGGDPDIISPTEHPSAGMEATNPDWKLADGSDGSLEDPYKIGRTDYWYYNWAEFPEIPSSIHCLCLTATGTRFDRGYYNLCQEAVKARPIDVWFSAPGKKLITDAEGAVIGVIINKEGTELKIKANGGVVLACGGFEHNQEMIASYLQMPYVHQQGGLYNDGDGIKMALGAGADLWHMSNSAGFTWTHKRPHLDTVSLFGGPNAKSGIYVGLGGDRFMDESGATRHGRIYIGGRWISTPMPLPAYLVQDSDQLAAGNKLVGAFSDDYADEIATGEVLMGETLEDLAEAIRQSEGGKDAPDFSTERFVATVNAYNKRYDAGEDADYGRPFDTMVPVKTGPFYATKIGPTYFNTQGGPRKNKFGQVINTDGMPIEGLFEAGEMGSIFCDMYNGSGNLGETMVFGRISGTNAAKRAKGEFKSEEEPVTTFVGEIYADGTTRPASEVDAAAEDVTGTFIDGEYEGSGNGINGKIDVKVIIKDGKIENVEIVNQQETEGIGAVALPEYVSQTLEKQGLDIDVITGATVTMDGYKEAVNDALSKAVG
ncbi:MAG: FAD-binding protein [Blautia sp.]|nr:FAD-binding protein [Blautia sp.]